MLFASLFLSGVDLDAVLLGGHQDETADAVPSPEG